MPSLIVRSPEPYNVLAGGRGRVVALDQGTDDVGIRFGGGQEIGIRVACLGPSNATIGAEEIGEIDVIIECDVREEDRLTFNVRVPVTHPREPGPIRLANYGMLRFGGHADSVNATVATLEGTVGGRSVESRRGGSTHVSASAADGSRLTVRIRPGHGPGPEPKVSLAGSRVATFRVEGEQRVPRRWHRNEDVWLALLTLFAGAAIAFLIQLLPPPRRRKDSVAA